MPVSVNPVNAGHAALVLEAVELVDELEVLRDEAPAADELLRFGEEPALLGGTDRNFPGAPTLAPAGAKHEPVPSVR